MADCGLAINKCFGTIDEIADGLGISLTGESTRLNYGDSFSWNDPGSNEIDWFPLEAGTVCFLSSDRVSASLHSEPRLPALNLHRLSSDCSVAAFSIMKPTTFFIDYYRDGKRDERSRGVSDQFNNQKNAIDNCLALRDQSEGLDCYSQIKQLVHVRLDDLALLPASGFRFSIKEPDHQPLVLPILLTSLIKEGTWKQFEHCAGKLISEMTGQADTAIKLVDDLGFLKSLGSRRECQGLSKFGLNSEFDRPEFFKSVVFIGFGARDGDDTWLALDFSSQGGNGRSSGEPRVVVSKFDADGMSFIEIASTFSKFVATLRSSLQ